MNKIDNSCKRNYNILNAAKERIIWTTWVLAPLPAVVMDFINIFIRISLKNCQCSYILCNPWSIYTTNVQKANFPQWIIAACFLILGTIEGSEIIFFVNLRLQSPLSLREVEPCKLTKLVHMDGAISKAPVPRVSELKITKMVFSKINLQ